MSTWKVYGEGGQYLGTYTARTKRDALDAIHADAGYANTHDCLQMIGHEGSLTAAETRLIAQCRWVEVAS
mgnify:CR=1 FL=1